MPYKMTMWFFLLNIISFSATAQNDVSNYDVISRAQSVSSITVFSSFGDGISFRGSPSEKLQRMRKSAAIEVKVRSLQGVIDIVTSVTFEPSVQCNSHSNGYADAIVDIRYRDGKKKEYWYIEGQIFDPIKKTCFSSPKIIEKILNI